jgi:hypothetical protein
VIQTHRQSFPEAGGSKLHSCNCSTFPAEPLAAVTPAMQLLVSIKNHNSAKVILLVKINVLSVPERYASRVVDVRGPFSPVKYQSVENDVMTDKMFQYCPHQVT